MVATMVLNAELNGIEIKFDVKPLKSTLDTLKAAGFRWHNLKKVWYAKQTDERIAVARIMTETEECAEKIREEEPKAVKKLAEKANRFGVKVGDIFSASWGYEQTNNDFFQVVALVGESSVRVREVNPPMIKSDAVSGMSEDRTFKISRELLPAAPHSSFIKDQEKGDLKRLKSYAADGKSNPQFYLTSYTDAHYCQPGEITVYESGYY